MVGEHGFFSGRQGGLRAIRKFERERLIGRKVRGCEQLCPDGARRVPARLLRGEPGDLLHQRQEGWRQREIPPGAVGGGVDNKYAPGAALRKNHERDSVGKCEEGFRVAAGLPPDEFFLRQGGERRVLVPGVGEQTAIYLIIATKGFKAFNSSRKFACYAGVAPFEYTSGSSVRGRTKVNHMADKKMKSLLQMCALTAIKYDPQLKEYYNNKKEEGKNGMLVLNNIRCKIISRVFSVVNRKTPFINTYKFAS